MKVGSMIFWIASFFAALIVLWSVTGYFYNLSESYPVLNVTALGLAAVIWIVGLMCRRAL
ncbi:MAG TPA: hypothetical protein VMC05_10220 [Xanthobacteraceae bacterium]|nr:hypothetical protein [Xanthobacteraceae bacterium]